MSKTVLAGILGGLTLATGFLCYTIYQRDKEEDSEEKDSSINLSDISKESTHVKEEINDPLVEEVLIAKSINKKKRTTSRNLSTKKTNTKRNRTAI